MTVKYIILSGVLLYNTFVAALPLFAMGIRELRKQAAELERGKRTHLVESTWRLFCIMWGHGHVVGGAGRVTAALACWPWLALAGLGWPELAKARHSWTKNQGN